MNWQPIETTPKDGTDVLLYVEGRPPLVAGFYHGRWETFDGRSGFEPTHWMTLPAAPDEITP